MKAVDLAKKAGLSPATISAALGGRPISKTSVMLIARALEATPVDETIKRLLAPIVSSSPDERLSQMGRQAAASHGVPREP
jgi:lambda repressor-like predicted transcriptional regulator